MGHCGTPAGLVASSGGFDTIEDRVLGIVIEMYFVDHPPPHFHARYSGDEALIVIETGDVFAGSLPGRAVRLVCEWLDEHRDELVANWDRASAGQQTESVDPLR
jgi:hypothetical protein